MMFPRRLRKDSRRFVSFLACLLRGRNSRLKRHRETELYKAAEILEDRTLLTNFNVTSTLDEPDANLSDPLARSENGNATLRAAIQQANFEGGFGAHTIVIQPGLYTLTQAGAREDRSVTGDLDIFGAPILSIRGAGIGSTIIDAGQIDRVFEFDSFADITVSDLTIRGGLAELSFGGGGGILNRGRLTLENVEVTGNRSVRTGGGIENLGALTLQESIVSNNRADATGFNGVGGGIYNVGSLLVDRSEVTGNTSAGTAAAILNQTSTLTRIIDSTISGNTSGPFQGGVIQNNDVGILEITNSSISHNGNIGIFNRSSGTIAVRGSLFDGNGVGGISGQGTIDIADSAFNNNRAGGAVNSAGTLTITNSSFDNNSANLDGGAISIGGGTAILDTLSITNNTADADNNDFGGGGGIHLNRGIVTLRNSLIAGNSARDGGGIENEGGTITITNTTISQNSAKKVGGGLKNFRAFSAPPTTANLNHVTITGNDGNTSRGQFGGFGGGVVVGGIRGVNAVLNFRNTIIAGNRDFSNRAHDASGLINSQGHNLIQNPSGADILGNTTGNILGQDPLLGLLQDNGGPSFTHELLSGSPAIDAGDPANTLPTDQRGVTRPSGNGPDIGAFEDSSAPAPLEIDIPVDGEPDRFLLRLQNGNIEFVDSGTGQVIASQSLAGTSNIVIDGVDNEDDSLLIDFGPGNPIPAGGLTYNGGAGGDDDLAITGGIFGNMTLIFDNPNDGSIVLDGSTITYTGLEPITSTITASNVTLNYSGSSETITITDAGSGQTTVDSTAGEIVTFNNPSNSLAINAGGGNDTLIMTGLALTASVFIDGDTGTDLLSVDGVTISGSSGDGLTVDNSETVNISSSTFNGNSSQGLDIFGAENVTINNVVASDNGDDGIQIDIANTVNITDTTTNDNGDEGADIENISGTTTIDTLMSNNNNGDGISLFGISNVSATNVTTNLNGGDGLEIVFADNVTINDGMYDSNGEEGVQINEAEAVSVTDAIATSNTGIGLSINSSETVTLLRGTFNDNVRSGISLQDHFISATVTDVDASSNTESGLAADSFPLMNISGGTYVANGVDGIHSDFITFVNISGDTIANDNGANGLDITRFNTANISLSMAINNGENGAMFDNADNDVTITGGMFNDNVLDGIELTNVDGDVTTTDVTATGNDPGIFIDGAGSYTDNDGNFSNNDDGGLVITNITNDVRLFGTVANDNDADVDNVGDGLNVSNVNRELFIDDATFNGGNTNQWNGISASNIIGNTVFQNTTVANDNDNTGISLTNFSFAIFNFFTTMNGNGFRGFNASNGAQVLMTDNIYVGNASNSQFEDITDVLYFTTTVPPETVDKVTLRETTFTHQRDLIEQDTVNYIDLFNLRFRSEGGNDVYVVHSNVNNPANANNIVLNGGAPSAGPNARPGDLLVMTDFGGTAAYTDPTTGTGQANTTGGAGPIDFEDIEDIVFADEHEFNDTLATATVLGSDMSIITGGSIHNVEDEDFFKVTAKMTGVLQFNLFTTFGLFTDLDMQILDADGDVIATLDSTSDNEFVAIPVVAQKMYYARVYGKNNDEEDDNYGNYDLEIENTPLAITPQAVHMDPASDTGMMSNDNYTADNTPRFIIQADLDEIVDPNNDGTNDIAILSPTDATAGNVPGAAVWVSITNSTSGDAVSGFADQIGASSLFTFTPAAALADGVYFITSAVQIIDGSNPNMSDRGPLSVPLWFTVDTVAPDASDVTLDMLSSSDSFGPIGTDTDNLTNKMSPAFDGVAEANAKIRVLANGRLVGSGVVNTDRGDGLGTWEITVEPLTDGGHLITLELEDAAGNITQTGQLGIVVDTLPPQRPTIDLFEADDSGMSNMDNVTNNDTDLRFRISAEPGSEVFVKNGETVISQFQMPNDDFVTFTTNLPEGPNPLSVEAFDIVGNRSAQSHELLVTVDTQVPNAGLPPFLLPSSDSGMLANDLVTNKMSPAFSGIGEPNAKVRVFANGLVVGQGVVNSSGDWEVTVEPLVDGVYDITSEFEDLAGNISDQSQARTIVIDTEAPNTPYLDLLGDTGHSSIDNITADNTPQVSMTSEDPNIELALALFEDNLKFRIYDRYEGSAEFLLYDSIGDADVFNESEPADFFTELTLILETLPEQYAAFFPDNPPVVVGGVLADGVHNLKLEVEDRAGNISHDFLLSITIDTTTMAVDTPILLESSDTGMLNDDMVINKDQPAFMGVAEANAIVRIYARDVDTGTVQLVGENIVGSDLSDVSIGGDVTDELGGEPDDGYGLWEITVEPLDDGHYEVFVEVEDWAGNIVVSEPKEIWVDTVEPNTPILDLVTDSGRHDADNITNVNRSTFDINVDDTPDGGLNLFPNDLKYRVYLRPGDGNGEILIYDSYSDNGNNFVSGGSFTHTLTQTLNDPSGVPFADGVYDLKLEVEDRAGNISHDYLLGLTIDTLAPPVNIVDIDPATSDSGVAGQPETIVDRITSDSSTGFFGYAEADAIVRLYVDADPISDGVIDSSDEYGGQTVATPFDGNQAYADGQWNMAAFFDLNDPTRFEFDGLRQIGVKAEDLAGNISYTGEGEGDSEKFLEIFLDTQGPVVTSVRTVTNPLYDLFETKPSDGPTPPTKQIDIVLSDLPDRGALLSGFVYFSANEKLAEQIGHYTLVGDNTGNVAIISAILFDGSIPSRPGDSFVRLTFADLLEDDRYTLTVSDTITDDAGNALDGESNAVGNSGSPDLPSGDSNPGGDFVARFTIDSRAEIGTWGQAGVFVDGNGNYLFDPAVAGGINHDVSRDLVFDIGIQTDNIFAGQFKPAGAILANGYDRIGAYGLIGGTYRFLLDFDDNGRIDAGETIVSNVQVNAFPISGNFDGNAANGDEIGLFDGASWYFDTTGDNLLDTTIGGGLRGLPITGDFDGDGLVDLGAYIASSNAFFFSLSASGGSLAGGNSNTTDTFVWGFPGVLERPFAGGDFNLDGIDDFGLTTPRQDGTDGELEWYIVVSDHGPRYFQYDNGGSGFDDGGGGGGAPAPGIADIFEPFSPTPLGNDIFTLYNGTIAVPVVGNFDPPNSLTSSTEFLPLTSTTDTTPTLEWNSVSGASEYEVLLYNVDLGQQVAHAILDATSYTATVAAGNNYQAFVRPVNNYDETGSWSSPFYFSIDGLIAPEITSPANTTGDATPTIAWTTTAGASSYNVLVYSLSVGQEVARSFGQAGTEFTPTTPLPGAGDYQVYVQAADAIGSSSWRKHVFEMTASVASLPGAPTVTSPSGTENDSTPTIAWTEGENADSHEMLIYNIATGQEVASETGLTGTSFTIDTPLAVSGTHQIYLRAVNSLGNSGWNTPFTFELILKGNEAPSAPTLLSPTVPIDDFTPTFAWTESANADSYELLVYHIETGQEVFWQKNLTTTSYSPSSLLPGTGHYQVFLRATNSFGTSGWSAASTFEIAMLDELIEEVSDHETRSAETETASTEELDAVMAEWSQTDWWQQPAATE